MTREELIQELALKLCLYEEPSWMDLDGWEREMWIKRSTEVYEMFESRQKLLLEKIGKPLREYKDYCVRPCGITIEQWKEWASRDMQTKAIDEALAIIEKESEQ